ncbi:hypothetical protein FLAG1_08215 [Fusarium langsethiae]|uniref:Histidine-specific methyltransferase SAM-dependent domain-containing protein n=1 Tax=Fusarium langsethiae TaxID=179993 RepID=A0A0M9ET47_FUSLA|nr:hypothetical protein FLAG1_08215 [Fusarium langsethiae]
MVPMDRSLRELSSQSHAGTYIEQLIRWMSDARDEIEISTPTLPLVRALLLAALCYQYDDSITLASDCFEKAKAMFDKILFFLGGLDGLEERLPDDDFCDLALASWGFFKYDQFFAFLDLTDRSPVLVPLVRLNLGLVQEKYGRQAEEILFKKQSCINFKAQASNLQCSSVAFEPLLAMLRAFKALQIPTDLISGEVTYPIAYFQIFYQVSEWPDSRGSTQTRGEVEIIRRLAPQIAADLKDWHEPLLVEYGPGDGLKTEILLDAIESRCIKCTYVGVDINQRCLDRCLAAWKEKYTFIKCTGICGSFEDATSLVEKWPGNKLVFSLASTPNSKPVEYILFLQRLAKLARKIIISQQRPDGQQGLHNSYHTEDFEKFVWRGLQHGNRLLKRPEFNEQDWEIKCDHSKTNIYWCHEFKITPLRSTDQKSSFQAFASIKYTDAGFVMIAKNAGLEVTRTDKNDDTGMAIYQLKVGSRYENKGQVLLQHDSRLREATNWPQDEAAIMQEVAGRRSASYIEVQGGNGRDRAPGTILRRATVDLTHIMPFCKHEKVTTLATVMKAMRRPRTVDEIECEVSQFRDDLLQLTLKITDEHQASGRTGAPVVVVVLHGGIFNFIVNNWNCKFKRETNRSNWEWCASTTLGNGDVTVFEFSNCGKTLEEISRKSYFEEVFGDKYRNLAEENLSQPYYNIDGTPVDEKQEHVDFMKRTGTAVAAVPTKALEIVWSEITAGEN